MSTVTAPAVKIKAFRDSFLQMNHISKLHFEAVKQKQYPTLGILCNEHSFAVASEKYQDACLALARFEIGDLKEQKGLMDLSFDLAEEVAAIPLSQSTGTVGVPVVKMRQFRDSFLEIARIAKEHLDVVKQKQGPVLDVLCNEDSFAVANQDYKNACMALANFQLADTKEQIGVFHVYVDLAQDAVNLLPKGTTTPK